MVRCSRCGKDIGSAASCPECGGGPSQSMVDKSARKVTNVTGEVIEAGVHATETVVRETKPIFKKALSVGKKGVSKAKSETLSVAKKLKDEES